MTLGNRPHILILPRWYPSRKDTMTGIFVQLQAEALAVNFEVSVLYVLPDPDCPNDMETELSVENRVQVIRVFYRTTGNDLDRWYRFYRAHMNGLRLLDGNPPDLVHVHVLTREGVMGYLIARKFRVPYVISEHWSRYYPANDFYKGFVRKRATEFVVAKAAALLPVSAKLMKAMMAKGITHPECHIVPNVIDTTLFRPSLLIPETEQKTIVHVSCFDDRSKNITGLLDAVKKVSSERNDFVLRLIGTGPDLERMKRYAEKAGLEGTLVVFAGLKNPDEVAEEYRNADFSLVSSRYETFGSVIIESLACGTPVLATDTGIASEVLGPHNGLIVRPDDTNELSDGILRMLDICRSFDRNTVSRSVAEAYTPEGVVRRIASIYDRILQKSNV
ncbi:MAG TPA: glycosyltransferase [Bacteroidales bacterium]|nr:glycosyltransferase [Bacteroidales bacterium]